MTGLGGVTGAPSWITVGLVSAVNGLVGIATGWFLTRSIGLQSGPSAIVAFAQVTTVVSLGTMWTGGALSVGITRHVARFRLRPDLVLDVLGGATTIILLSCVLVVGTLMPAASVLARALHGDDQLVPLMPWVIAALPAYGFNAMITAFWTGQGRVERVLALQLLFCLLQCAIAILTVPHVGLAGGVGSLVVAVWVTACAMAILERRILGQVVRRLTRPAWRVLHGRFLGAAMMPLVSVAALSTVNVTVRRVLLERSGSYDAAVWQVLTQLSDGYSIPFALFAGLYVLPRAASAEAADDLVRVIREGATAMSLGFLCIAPLLWWWGEQSVRVISGDVVAIAPNLLVAQGARDMLKVLSWTVSYVVMARARAGPFVCLELVFAGLVVAGASILLPDYGVIGAVLSSAIAYMVYLVGHGILCRQELMRLRGGG